ncbi:hypothetical protein FH972_007236 [Carpinus fangiana]|uniref:F-box domain-containing protein n=1 Tax=Carpinus fangiana TaxID=176857 RepID=A0A5N6QVS2_9ROSI|nr:hypothetical protein FH972_007236 [Carpinus fangiana]
MSKGKEIEGEEEREDMCGNDSEVRSEKRLLARDSGSSICIYAHSSSGGEPQDADYSLASLSDELEALILARVPRSEYCKFSFVSRRFLSLVKSGEVYKIRRAIGFKEPSVFMLAIGEKSWWAFDRQFRADFNKGWGIAFKSLGDELLVMGASSVACAGRGMAVYTCCPDPQADELQWRALDCGTSQLSHFIWNCSVMVA